MSLNNTNPVLFAGIPMVVAALLLAYALFSEQSPLNAPPRGDVTIDAATAESLAKGWGFLTPWERGSPFYPPIRTEQFGHPADQHPPLWPLLGAMVIKLFNVNGINALQWVSFLSHLLILFLLYLAALRCELKRLSVLPPLFYALCSLGAAYSFNGSLYAGQAVLYLGAALVMGKPELTWKDGLLLGSLLGGACLINYQSLPLIPAFLLTRLVMRGKHFFSWGEIRIVLITIILFIAALSPWMLRNLEVFQSPFYSVNPNYALAKAGVGFTHTMEAGRLLLVPSEISILELVKGFARCAWQNIPYLMLLLLILFPGALGLICFQGPGLLRKNKLTPYLMILLFHLIFCILWPALKLRYMTPCGPLILLIAWVIAIQRKQTYAKWVITLFAVLSLACIAIWLKGSLHGKSLFLAFLICFAPLVLVFPPPLRKWTPLLFGILSLFSVGALPGSAYFNLKDHPDFFGIDMETREKELSLSLEECAEELDRLGVERVIGDLKLWSINPRIRLYTLPLANPEEDYKKILNLAAKPFNIRFVFMQRQAYEGKSELLSLKMAWKNKDWVILDLLEEK